MRTYTTYPGHRAGDDLTMFGSTTGIARDTNEAIGDSAEPGRDRRAANRRCIATSRPLWCPREVVERGRQRGNQSATFATLGAIGNARALHDLNHSGIEAQSACEGLGGTGYTRRGVVLGREPDDGEAGRRGAAGRSWAATSRNVQGKVREIEPEVSLGKVHVAMRLRWLAS